jgi:hypothetical protein
MLNHLTIVLLIVAVGLATAGATLLGRRLWPRIDQADAAPSSAVLSYVAAAFGILVGFVIVFLLGQAANARQAIADEATSIGTAFDEAQLFPAGEPGIQRALICYSRAVTEREWPAMGNGGSAPEVDVAYRDLIAAYGEVREPTPSTFQPAAATNSFVQLGGISTARETRLVAAESGVGALLWSLLLGSAVFILAMLFLVSAAARPWAQAVLLGFAGAFTAVLLLIVLVLGRPFREGTGPLTSTLIDQNNERMIALAPDAAAEPCTFEAIG